jgi:small subunit ribosomal protein S5
MKTFTKQETKKDKFEDRVISVSRVSKTIKGGRRLSFSVMVVVGDRAGQVGFGLGKAREVPEAVKKAVADAKKNLVQVCMVNESIPYDVLGHYNATKVILRGARHGRGLVVGGAVRAVAELAGLNNLVAKIHGSRNPRNVVRAVLNGFLQLQTRDHYLQDRFPQKPQEAAL